MAGIIWAGYQYLLLVYTGTTAGLKFAKLRLDRFDGSSGSRKTRRWRVLASVLSGLSLGLGYAWCFLDEDRTVLARPHHPHLYGTHKMI